MASRCIATCRHRSLSPMPSGPRPCPLAGPRPRISGALRCAGVGRTRARQDQDNGRRASFKEPSAVSYDAMRPHRFPPCATRPSRPAKTMTDRPRQSRWADGFAPGNGPPHARCFRPTFRVRAAMRAESRIAQHKSEILDTIPLGILWPNRKLSCPNRSELES